MTYEEELNYLLMNQEAGHRLPPEALARIKELEDLIGTKST